MLILLKTKLLMCDNRSGIGVYVATLKDELTKAGVGVLLALENRSFFMPRTIRNLSVRLITTFGGFLSLLVRQVFNTIGQALLEAMPSGVLVIVSDIPPHTEVAGNAALFFEHADCETLADAIARGLSSPSLAVEAKQKGLKKSGEYS